MKEEKRINNELYNSSDWYSETDPMYLLKNMVNPCRVGYFNRILTDILKVNSKDMKALEVGCGGGILTMEIARTGFETTGIDLSSSSIIQARMQAEINGLSINYQVGDAMHLPFEDKKFDVVFCCDVLEHLPDVNKAVAEISRVLKNGGTFFYDTINRTILSKLVVIKIAQEWKRYAFMPPNLHVWKMFIKPAELKSVLFENGFDNKDIKGMVPNVNPLKMLPILRKRAKGDINYKQLGEKVFFIESKNDFNISYMGYAVKK